MWVLIFLVIVFLVGWVFRMDFFGVLVVVGGMVVLGRWVGLMLNVRLDVGVMLIWCFSYLFGVFINWWMGKVLKNLLVIIMMGLFGILLNWLWKVGLIGDGFRVWFWILCSFGFIFIKFSCVVWVKVGCWVVVCSRLDISVLWLGLSFISWNFLGVLSCLKVLMYIVLISFLNIWLIFGVVMKLFFWLNGLLVV